MHLGQQLHNTHYLTKQSGKYLTTDGTNESWADVTTGIEDNGTFTTLTVSGGATIQDITGQYGSIEIDNGATGGWEGYSIGGQCVYMSNGSAQGLYNDVNNQWGIYSVFNGATDIRHAGSAKVTTTSDGATINGNAYFNSGYGSNRLAYACRVWVNFRGTSTVTIRRSGGVSSVSDLGVGRYRVNFNFTMPDNDYAITGVAQLDTTNIRQRTVNEDITDHATTSCRIVTMYSDTALQDCNIVNFMAFR